MYINENDLLPFFIFGVCFLYNIIYLAIFSQNFRKGLSIFVCFLAFLALINWFGQGAIARRWNDIGFLVFILLFVLISGLIAMVITGVMAVKAARQNQHSSQQVSTILVHWFRLSPIAIIVIIIMQLLKFIPQLIWHRAFSRIASKTFLIKYLSRYERRTLPPLCLVDVCDQ